MHLFDVTVAHPGDGDTVENHRNLVVFNKPDATFGQIRYPGDNGNSATP